LHAVREIPGTGRHALQRGADQRSQVRECSGLARRQRTGILRLDGIGRGIGIRRRPDRRQLLRHRRIVERPRAIEQT
jgi:hypothetical protein